MTNTEPRERVAGAMWNAEGPDGDPHAGPKRWENMAAGDPAYNMMDTYRIEADAAITAHQAWLWERADDPEVIEAVAKSIQEEVDGYYSGFNYGDATEKEARAALHAGLTALIGPRPGSEAPNGPTAPTQS